MKTWVDDARFVTRFAGDNLDHYRAGDWMNLREEIADYLHGARAATELAVVAKGLKSITESALRDLQRDVRNVLGSFVAVRDLPPQGVAFSSTLLQAEQRWGPIPRKPRGPGALSVVTSARDGFLLKTLFLLLRGGSENVRRCPECRTLFWRVGRKLYCSRPCVNRANMRAYRAGKSRRRTKTVGRKR